VPTLNEIIDLVNRKVPIIVELKSPNIGKTAAKIINNYLARGWKYKSHTIIWLFVMKIQLGRS
jgi:glycerophosphoryl diester phosphodiesterase